MPSDPYYRSALTKINERTSGSAPPPAPAKVNTAGRIVSNVRRPSLWSIMRAEKFDEELQLIWLRFLDKRSQSQLRARPQKTNSSP